jgi:hypothetical protein
MDQLDDTATIDWPTMLLRAEQLLRAAAPQLDAITLYFVTQTGTDFADSALLAFTHPALDLWFQPRLGTCWLGRGAAILFNDTPSGVAGASPPELLADHVAALAVHEAAHFLADGWAMTRAEAPEPDAEESEAYSRRIVPVVAAYEADRAPLPVSAAINEFFARGERWLRAVLHLRARIEALGTFLPALP